MNGHHRRTLKNEKNLFTVRAGRDNSSVIPALYIWVEVRASGIQTDADQFDKLNGQNISRPGIRRHLHAFLSPGRIPFSQFVQGRIPGAYRMPTHRVLGRLALGHHILFLPPLSLCSYRLLSSFSSRMNDEGILMCFFGMLEADSALHAFNQPKVVSRAPSGVVAKNHSIS